VSGLGKDGNVNDKARITDWLYHECDVAWLRKEKERFDRAGINTEIRGKGGKSALFYTDGYFDISSPYCSIYKWYSNEVENA